MHSFIRSLVHSFIHSTNVCWAPAHTGPPPAPDPTQEPRYMESPRLLGPRAVTVPRTCPVSADLGGLGNDRAGLLQNVQLLGFV